MVTAKTKCSDEKSDRGILESIWNEKVTKEMLKVNLTIWGTQGRVGLLNVSREDREESEADRAEFGILRCMNLKRTGGAVYDLKYHVVWVPKYRRIVLGERVARRLKRIFQEIAERYGFEIDTQEVLLDDHVHIFLSAPPRYSPAQVVQRLKSISAQMVFQEFPEVKQQLWSGELWNDGYFVRSVGDNVTAEVIRRDIKHQHDPKQLELNF